MWKLPSIPQFDGISEGSLVCRVKPCLDSSRTTSQCDAPSSPPKSIACCRLEGSLSCNLAAALSALAAAGP